MNEERMKVLSGDIGGTKTRLALFETDGRHFQTILEQSFPSPKYQSLGDIVRRFVLPQKLQCDRACFGIAGPVMEGQVKTTNLPWVVQASEIASSLGIKEVSLINDLEANAYGIAILEGKDFLTLNEGKPGTGGNLALIAAGTGLGEAALFWDGTGHRPFASEGGHADFAPAGELEGALLKHLSSRFGHVSWERVLSGPGLANIHAFLSGYRETRTAPCRVETMPEKERPAAISRAALSGGCSICQESLALFIKFYGAEAGNLALKVMATAGLYLGGGIAPKIVDALKGSAFMEAFCAKGRMRPLLEAIPVRVILNDRTALLGAARHAFFFPGSV